jgi:hypothetical protein
MSDLNVISNDDMATLTYREQELAPPKRIVTIFKPRLDITFKQGPIPDRRGPVSPIRVHWQSFVERLADEHRRRGDVVAIIEKPLWQITPQFVMTVCEMMIKDEGSVECIAYIPHRDRTDFPLNHPVRARYYMQTVFPHCFTIDPDGWGASMSVAPVPVEGGDANTTVYDYLRQRIMRNESKFDQPQRTGRSPHWTPYVAFLCQLPHDETIRKHSAVGVATALEATLAWAQAMSLYVVVKGHPVNPGSMDPLRTITRNHRFQWVDDISIHDVIEHSTAVFTVNSGSGIEAMLHGKPVFTFGRSEYETAVNVTTPGFIARSWANDRTDLISYRRWFDNYWRVLYDTQDSISFRKVP